MPCHRRVELGPKFVAETVASLPVRAALERPEDDPDAGEAAAELDLYVEGENVFARGQLSGWIAVACSRCVGLVKVEVEEPLQVTFMPAGRVPDAAGAESEGEGGDDEEGEVEFDADADDIDLYPYHGQEVDLEPLMRERIILAVPFAPLCSESCQGLCPSCGIDRNTGSCTCEPPHAEQRWSALKNLKL
jgi:uncharacterized protein